MSEERWKKTLKGLLEILGNAGFHLADCAGQAKRKKDFTIAIGELGLLLKPVPTPKRSLFRRKEKRIFFGVIWFHDSGQFSPKTHWLLQVHGDEHRKRAIELATLLMGLYDVHIHVDVRYESKVEVCE
jgi:hypothetical protein